MLEDTTVRNRQDHHRKSWQLAAVVLLAGLASGCSESSSASVSGKVTFKGEPVVHGDVTFFQSSTGRVAQSSLDSEGNYSLNLSQGGDLPAGEFRVTVTPEVSYVEVDLGARGKDLKEVIKGAKSIPRIYQGRKSTPLKTPITGGEDTFDFELMPSKKR